MDRNPSMVSGKRTASRFQRTHQHTGLAVESTLLELSRAGETLLRARTLEE